MAGAFPGHAAEVWQAGLSESFELRQAWCRCSLVHEQERVYAGAENGRSSRSGFRHVERARDFGG